jgi:hypothetical protein
MVILTTARRNRGCAADLNPQVSRTGMDEHFRAFSFVDRINRFNPESNRGGAIP